MLLDDLDRRLIALLQADARASAADLARQLGVARTTGPEMPTGRSLLLLALGPRCNSEGAGNAAMRLSNSLVARRKDSAAPLPSAVWSE